jgi:hypothetical protein
MKVLILVPFAAAIISSIVWYEAAEQNLTRAEGDLRGDGSGGVDSRVCGWQHSHLTA